MDIRRLLSLASMALLTLVWQGCKRDEVQVYQAPKDLPPPASSTATAASNEPGAGGSHPDGAQSPPWVTPEGWQAVPSNGGMRLASYAIQGSDGRTASVSVVPLGPEASDVLENVNRWRRELQLAPITAGEVDTARQPVKIGAIDAKLFEFVSEQPILDGKFKSRTLVSMLAVEQATIFFKMMGEDALVAENKPKYIAWLRSVAVGAPENAPAATAAPTSGGPSMAGPVSPPPATGLPTWTPPSTWQSVPGNGMRLASFAVPGADGSKGDLSVVALGAQAGGVVANVARWRQQMELPPLGETELSNGLKSLTTTAGDKALVIELEGAGGHAGSNLLAAIVARADRTWFYKLTGPKALVSLERDNFQKFVQSVVYP